MGMGSSTVRVLQHVSNIGVRASQHKKGHKKPNEVSNINR